MKRWIYINYAYTYMQRTLNLKEVVHGDVASVSLYMHVCTVCIFFATLVNTIIFLYANYFKQNMFRVKIAAKIMC